MNQQAASDRLDADVFYRQNDLGLIRDNDLRERLNAEMFAGRIQGADDSA